MGGSNSAGGMCGRASSAQLGGQHDAQCTWSRSLSAYANLFSAYSELEEGVGC